MNALSVDDGPHPSLECSLNRETQNMVRPIDAITGRFLEAGQECRIAELRPGVVDYLRRRYPSLRPDDCIDRQSVEDIRRQSILDLLREDRGELTPIENEVAESISSREILAENTETEFGDNENLGSRVADLVADFGGSWTFIIGFSAFLAAWMAYNTLLGSRETFDAYPFVLLNLVLSTVAAFQAPVIMMSQRRQEAKDRLRSNNDYKVNLKAELEIRRLHEKVDHIIAKQWRSLDAQHLEHSTNPGRGKSELPSHSKQPRVRQPKQRTSLTRKSATASSTTPAR